MMESTNSWFVQNRDELTKDNVVTKFFEEFGIEGDPPCNGLSLLTKLSRKMTKIKEHKRNKKTHQFLLPEFTLPATSTATVMTVVEREHLICKNKLLMKESKLKMQLETEEDFQEKCNLQYKCMEELSDNLSQIIVGKMIVEDELKRLKMAYLKNEKELAYLKEKLE